MSYCCNFDIQRSLKKQCCGSKRVGKQRSKTIWIFFLSLLRKQANPRLISAPLSHAALSPKKNTLNQTSDIAGGGVFLCHTQIIFQCAILTPDVEPGSCAKENGP